MIVYMNKVIALSVKTTKNFILIKIPRNLVMGPLSSKTISSLEQGIQESTKEVLSGKVIGPFRNGKEFLRVLKSPKK